ncbi:GspE/PulE family protein [Clostridium formicaceticum]|uniref:Type II secretion system protein E n=1 Tax=Clostridium formicaceticum TaxID=1497 RepID=A0AAC9RL45_9CLOT|nr:ATPase, T2SS/T4P/T4SS family [Clostridium formicaceticum]AOY77042.1 type II secretion system protein GspE [Clostridium formicaceticum]ARE87542.1 Type II secretion system protein E [Clostridium formicaceticum]
MITKNMRLGDILLRSGLITEEELKTALDLQKKRGKKLGELLIEEGFVTENQIIEVLEFQLGVPHMNLNKYYINPQAPKKISENLARKHLLIPINIIGEKLIVAMADPLNILAVDDVKLTTGLDVDVVIATTNDILNAINKYFDNREVAEQAIEEFTTQQRPQETDEKDSQLQADINNAPVVKLVNTIITQAVKSKASDIHIEPFEKNVRIRYRIDGDLKEIMTPAKATHSAIVTRIKIISKLDISEKRVPQDGRVEIMIENRPIDMRVSVLPTVYGEKVVIRLLDRSSIVIKKEQLGFTQQNLKLFNSIIKSPEGIILLTGPTGSGKTTTLYTMLQELNEVNKNIITVEDPVEYRLDGINQVQVNIKAGMTFAAGLRSILRQDPDIIMVGEIRDVETAQIAVRAAITGHLVLSTLHTNDTASSIARLMDMGIDTYLVASSVVGIIAQRLVKKVCVHCKITYQPTEEEKLILQEQGEFLLHKGKGCNACNNTGYLGRTAIHEIMPINREIRMLINRHAESDLIKDKALEAGMLTLFESCRLLVLKGVTTVDELLRVTYSVDI